MVLSRTRFLVVLLPSLLGGLAFAQVTARVSVSSAGAQATGASQYSLISADGRFVAFDSAASNLVAGDTNGSWDIFVRDLENGTTERVSISSLLAQGNDDSFNPTISSDGRYVAFESDATNLAPGDGNAARDILVHDRQTGTTELVSVDTNEVLANNTSHSPSISADGRFVVFTSIADNIVALDANGDDDVFLRDRQNGTTEQISVDTGGTEGNDTSRNSHAHAISADGRYVVYYSFATNLVVGDTNSIPDIFVRDRQLVLTTRVNLDSGGGQGNGNCFQPSISGNGRYVAFECQATNIVPGDTNGATSDVVVRDLTNTTVERVSLTSGGAQGNLSSAIACISADGRYVVFESLATNLVAGDTNGQIDVFRHDRQTGETDRMSVDSADVEGNNQSLVPSISADGRLVAFYSLATNLVGGDSNGVTDVFLRDNGAADTDTESNGIGGFPGNGNSSGPSVSADGLFLAFQSQATNLVAGDTNALWDIFVRDRENETTARASVDTGEVQANGDSADPAISSDGRYVAFDSVATNLVAGDTNGIADVFVRDTQLGTTVRVSVDGAGAQVNGASLHPTISADGRYVAFDSLATNLVAGDTNAAADVFVRDLQLNTTTRGSLTSGGVQANGGSTYPSFSADGRYVAFESVGTSLVAGDTNAVSDVFVRDLVGNTTARMSVDSGGSQGNAGSFGAAMSGDGLWVGFESDATNLVAGDTNTTRDVFARGRTSNITTRVSVDSGGTQGLGGGSSGVSVSFDGRNFGFQSDASNLVGGDTNAATDGFHRDRGFGNTRRVSVDSGGTQGLGGGSGGTSISADGRHVGFDSFANNLVDGDTNGAQDVFMRDLGTASAFLSFCYGDGTAGACPCSNSGEPGHGCENSGSTGGALLTVTGDASIAEDTVQLTSSFERPSALSVFLQGTAIVGPLNYGDGLRCAGGTLKRIYVKAAVNGVVVAPLTGDPSITARSATLGTPIPLGATRLYQVFYRDPPPGFCPSGTFNVSNGIAIAWGA